MIFVKKYAWWIVSLALAISVYSGYALTIAPPSDFPSDKIVVIARGTSVPEITEQLFKERIVAHPTLLRFVLRITGTATRVQTGAYLFKKPQNLLVLAYRLVTGSYDIAPARITLPEGITVRETAELISEKLPEISKNDFIRVAKPYEGYLFPDTYVFSSGEDAESIVATMRENFSAKITTLSDKISASGRSTADIVIMASLLEKEARSTEVRRIISGILWNRLKLGMPLQVDAVFGYIFNRDTYSPSYEDLKVESPYNTYIHTGLPPGPINNPGLDAIESAINPAKTNYLFYLTDKNGVMHYATNYATHQTNQRKYLW